MKRNEPGLEILKGERGRKEGIRDHEGWGFMSTRLSKKRELLVSRLGKVT